jgi:hypothetical protein
LVGVFQPCGGISEQAEIFFHPQQQIKATIRRPLISSFQVADHKFGKFHDQSCGAEMLLKLESPSVIAGLLQPCVSCLPLRFWTLGVCHFINGQAKVQIFLHWSTQSLKLHKLPRQSIPYGRIIEDFRAPHSPAFTCRLTFSAALISPFNAEARARTGSKALSFSPEVATIDCATTVSQVIHAVPIVWMVEPVVRLNIHNLRSPNTFHRTHQRSRRSFVADL